MHYKFGLNLSGCFFVAEILMNAGVLTGAFTCVFIKKNKPFPCFGNFCGKGNIINTASAGGIIGFPQAVSYAASKGGVISFTKAIAVDFAKDGIRCNAICPGTSETEMTEEVMHIDALRKSFLQPIPMQRFGKGTDVAYAALFLASDESSYLTGVILPVDGGWTMS